MLDTVDFNHVQHISFTQSRLTDAVSVILSELLSYEHPSKVRDFFILQKSNWFFSWFLKVCKTPCNACLEAFCRKGFGT